MRKGHWGRYKRGHWSQKIAHDGACKDRKSYIKTWYRAHADEQRIKNRAKYRELKMEVLTHYSGGTPRCACCDERWPQFLTLDHIKPIRRKPGRGNTKNSGTALYSRLRARSFPPGFQVLCFNCNCAKRTDGCCPHQRSSVTN